MINLIKFLFLGHLHKWKILKEARLHNKDNICIGQRYFLQCEKCGIVKNIDCC